MRRKTGWKNTVAGFLAVCLFTSVLSAADLTGYALENHGEVETQQGELSAPEETVTEAPAASSDMEESAPEEMAPQEIAQEETEPAGTDPEVIPEIVSSEEEAGEVSDSSDAPDGTAETAEGYLEIPVAGIGTTQDNDELFAGYVRQVMYEGIEERIPEEDEDFVTAPALQSAVPRLDGLDTRQRQVYNALKPKIKNVADGIESNTNFTVNLSFTVTAADVGKNSVSANDAAEYAAYNIIFPAINALLMDCPYDMYWFDKTTGFGPAYSIGGSSGSGTVVNVPSIGMPVAAAYSSSGGTGTHSANTTKTGAARAAAANATSIVNTAASTYNSDYEKLKYYLERICALTDYNWDAYQNNPAYGDPWQLIYVFDNNPDTKVVCEGYSKAFKYLCDLTNFKSNLTGAHLVSGHMSGGSGSGAHMWNTVRMDDGKYYLVDVTNCDQAQITYSLFLKGYSYINSGWYYYGNIGYYYDDETTGRYSQAELNLSSTDYAVQSPAVQVTVTFDLNGGGAFNDPASATRTVTVGGNYGTWMPTPSRTGYTLEGWYTQANGGTKVEASTKVTNASNHTLYAHWTANTYTVTFDLNGGGAFSNPSSATRTVTYDGTYGSTLGWMPTPTREGYTLEGWYTAASGGTKVEAFTKMTTAANHTLYAHWKKNGVTVTFDVNGGTLANSSDVTRTVTYEGAYGTLPAATRTGYTLEGWYTAASGGTKIEASTKVTNTSNHTLYAHWTKLRITVNFDANGGVLKNASDKTRTVKYDEAYGTLPEATRTGYTLEGWYTAASGGTKIEASTVMKQTSAQTLYAHWTANTYTVTFDLNGGGAFSNQSSATRTVTYDGTYGSTLGWMPTPTREGYTLEGWYTAADGGTKIEVSTKVTTASNHSLYAHWTKNSVAVTFDANGGTLKNASDKTRTVKYDEAYGTLPVATRTGYTLEGWYTQAQGGTKIESSTVMKQMSAHTLYAHWTKLRITVNFDANGGALKNASEKTRTVKYDEAYGTLPVATREGYTLEGWYTAASGGTKIEESTIMKQTSAQTLYAHWTANTYTVTFDLNGGGKFWDPANAQRTVTYDGSYGWMPTPGRTGYTLEGWYTQPQGGTKIVADTKVTQTANHTLYAHWTPNKYTVTLDAREGKVSPATLQVTYDNTYGTLPAPTRAGYHFDGWFTQAENGSAVSSDTKVTATSNHTLYAHWSPERYVVTLDANGGTIKTTTIEAVFGAEYGNLPIPAREGYIFDGWFTAASGGTKIETSTKVTTASNHTLHAHWSKDSVTVMFDVNGGTLKAASDKTRIVKYDEAYGTLPVATRTGYTLEGWYTQAQGGTKIESSTVMKQMSAHTLYAHWTKLRITVNFAANGGALKNTSEKTRTVKYDEAYGALPEATRMGYTLEGWYTAASGGTKIEAFTIMQQTSAQTLYAHWTANTYTVTFDLNGGGSFSDPKSATRTVTYDGTYGSTLGWMPTPTREGYTLEGWYTEASGGTKVEASTKVTTDADHTLYARWMRIYTVETPEATAMFDGELLESVTEVPAGTKVTLRSATYGAEIYYTTDGSTPDKTSELYEDAIEITNEIANKATNEVTVSAIAIKEGFNDSEILTVSYTIKNTSADWGDLVDEEEKTPEQITEQIEQVKKDVGDRNNDGKTDADDVPAQLWVTGLSDADYDGTSKTQPGMRVYHGKKLLTLGTDYTVKYANNKNAGNAMVMITGKGSYAGTITKTFLIRQLDIGKAVTAMDKLVDDTEHPDVTAHITLPYTGKVQKAKTALTYELNGKIVTLKEGSDYTFVWKGTTAKIDAESTQEDIDKYGESNANAFKAPGTWTIAIYGKGNYTGTREILQEIANTNPAKADPENKGTYGKQKTLITTLTIPAIPAQAFVYQEYQDDSSGGKKFVYKPEGNTLNHVPDAASEQALQVTDKTGTKDFEWNITDKNKLDENGKKYTYPLEYGKDYVLDYAANDRLGTAYVTIIGTGDYTGTKTVTFKINGISMSGAKMEDFKTTIEWDGTEKKQDEPKLYYQTGKGVNLKKDYLVKDRDYEVGYSGSVTDIGKVTVTYTGKGLYTGKLTKTYQITGMPMSKVTVNGLEKTYPYDGEPVKPQVILTDSDGFMLEEDKHYQAVYSKNDRAGTATVTYKGTGGYSGSLKKTFRINAYHIAQDGSKISVLYRGTDGNDQAWKEGYENALREPVYQKGGVKPEPVVKFDGKELTNGVDYTLKWTNNNQVKPAANGSKDPTVTITGKGAFTGSISRTFTIGVRPFVQKSSSEPDGLTIAATDVVYQNKPGICKPLVTITDTNGAKLAAGTDYYSTTDKDKNAQEKLIRFTYVYDTMVDVKSGKNTVKELRTGESTPGAGGAKSGDVVQPTDIIPAGTVIRVTVTGKGNYNSDPENGSHTISTTFRYIAGDIGKASVTVAVQTYDGRKVEPVKNDIKVKIGKDEIAKTDYEIVGYTNNAAAGTGKVTLRGIGNYGGTKTVNFKINAKSINYNIAYNNNADAAKALVESRLIAKYRKVKRVKDEVVIDLKKPEENGAPAFLAWMKTTYAAYNGEYFTEDWTKNNIRIAGTMKNSVIPKGGKLAANAFKVQIVNSRKQWVNLTDISFTGWDTVSDGKGGSSEPEKYIPPYINKAAFTAPDDQDTGILPIYGTSFTLYAQWK